MRGGSGVTFRSRGRSRIVRAVFYLVVIVLGMSFLVLYALNRDRWLESARRRGLAARCAERDSETATEVTEPMDRQLSRSKHLAGPAALQPFLATEEVAKRSQQRNAINDPAEYATAAAVVHVVRSNDDACPALGGFSDLRIRVPMPAPGHPVHLLALIGRNGCPSFPRRVL
jgi:hypothetical protein